MSLLQETFDCEAPVALVTGSGARRVGREIATELARHGCRTLIHAHQSLDQAHQLSESLRERFAAESIVVSGPVENSESAEHWTRQAVDAFGRLDILVNSAAIWWPTSIDQITTSELQRYFGVNVLGSFQCCRAAAAVMQTQTRGGSIVNLGDWATVRPYLDHAAYFLSKGSIDVMTRSLAVEFAQRNSAIRVNCVKPGPVMLSDDVSQAQRDKLAASTLTGQVGRAEHVAHAVRFLCENTFVNGVCLPVDGGRSVFAPDGLQVGENTG